MKVVEGLSTEIRYRKMSSSHVQVNSTQPLFYQVSKRVFDFLFALVGLMLTFPIILIFSLLIMIETPGTPYFFQERVGLHNKKFRIIKLRSMSLDAEKNGAQWATKNDPRITKIGSFIRKTRIDELPQFINVLKGDMSIVGPRPERPIFVQKFNTEIPGFENRLLVKPGLTGWAQVNGGYDLTPKEKLDRDIYYINHATFTFDLRIVLKTIQVVLTGNGAR